jgi:hypothetical protein
MNTLVLAWEFGHGRGHIDTLLAAGRALKAKFDRIAFVTPKPIESGLSEFRQLPCEIRKLQPYKRNPPRETSTFADVLERLGYADPEVLLPRMGAWRELLQELAPQYLIVDHAPTALLAARSLDLPAVCVGTGFTCTPDVAPLPAILPASASQLAASGRVEEEVLGAMNACIGRFGGRPLLRVGSLFNEVEAILLKTVPSLDPYGPRRATYVGAGRHGRGTAVSWPTGDGPRTFAYLKQTKAVSSLIHELIRRAHPSIVVVDTGGAPWSPPSVPDNLFVTTERVDIEGLADLCDIAVLNGGQATVLQFGARGKPMILAPVHPEQWLTTQRLVRAGAAVEISSAANGEGICKALDAVATERRKGRAQAFGQHLRDELSAIPTLEEGLDAWVRRANAQG